MAATPTLEQVLGDVRRGQVAYLALTTAQKRALKDRDGAIALDVLRHLLGARPATPRIPLTEQAFQKVARRLGHKLGQKRCRRLIALLRAAGVLEQAGSYRQRYRNSGVRSGFRVLLFRLACASRWVGARRATRQRPVGTRNPVKADFRVRWWQHALFGDPWGLPPPQLTLAQRRRMRSDDERKPGNGEPCRRHVAGGPSSWAKLPPTNGGSTFRNDDQGGWSRGVYRRSSRCAFWGASQHGPLLGAERDPHPERVALQGEAVVIHRPYGPADNLLVTAQEGVDLRMGRPRDDDAGGPSGVGSPCRTRRGTLDGGGGPSVRVDPNGEIFIRTDWGAETLDRARPIDEDMLDLIEPFQIRAARGPDLQRPRPNLRIVPGKLSGSPHIAHSRIETLAVVALADRGYDSEKLGRLYPQVMPLALAEAVDLERQLTENLQAAA